MTDFDTNIRNLIKVVEARPTLIPLLKLTNALGCRACNFYPDSQLWQADTKTVPPPEAEKKIESTLVWLLRRGFELHEYARFSLLDGLMQNHRWEKALDTVDDAYALTDLLIASNIFMESTKHWAGQPTPEISERLRRTIEPAICAALNKWIRPARPFVMPPTTSMLMRSLFGDAWCDLALNDISERAIFEVVAAWRPPFLPGRLPALPGPIEMPLPSI